MKIIADTHTHTIASDHAYSTVTENAKCAADAGLFALAITDHCPAMPDSPHIWYFDCLGAIPRYLFGVLMLRGAEVNLTGLDGQLDLPDETLKKLDWVIVSAHSCCIKSGTIEQNNKAWLKVAQNPYVDVIGHCGLPDLPFDYEKIIPQFKEAGKLVEINNGSLGKGEHIVKNNIEIAKICKKHRVSIVVNSDSHYCGYIGNFDRCKRLLSDIDFPQELIINADKDRFMDYLKNKRGHIF